MTFPDKIIRVFPAKTSMSPRDDYCYFGLPDMFLPEHNAVHISTVFTWDIPKALYLQKQWQSQTDKPVLVGGPAFGDPGGEFIPGMYVKEGITITSRGCPNKCSFCFVPKRCGELRELEVKPGRIILDDNLLACSDRHLDTVFAMLKEQKGIIFNQGLEAERIKNKILDKLRGLRIKEIWTAYDSDMDKKPVEIAIKRLKNHFTQNQIRVYVLIGYKKDTFEAASERCKWIYDIGGLPFAMLFRGETGKSDLRWRKFQRFWVRPAIYKSVIKKPELMNLPQYYRYRDRL